MPGSKGMSSISVGIFHTRLPEKGDTGDGVAMNAPCHTSSSFAVDDDVARVYRIFWAVSDNASRGLERLISGTKTKQV